MAVEGGNDFFLNFGSDAAPFARQIADDLNPGITKINELREALAAYERQAADSKAGSSPLGLTFEGLDAAAQKIEQATAGFSTKVESSIAKFVGVAEELEKALRSFRGVNPTAPRAVQDGRRQPPPVAGPPVRVTPEGNVVPVTGTRPVNRPTAGGDSQDYLRRLAILQEQDARKRQSAGVGAVTPVEAATAGTARKAKAADDTLSSANTAISKTAKSLATHLATLDERLKAMLDTSPTTAAGRRKARLEEEGDSGRLGNNASSEIQIGNTTANPIPVILVGGEAQAAGGHPHHPAHTPVATTATAAAQAKDAIEAAPAIINAERGTRKNPRALLPDQRPYDPSEYVYPFGGDPRKQATRAFGLRPGENFGQYSNRVNSVASRTNEALSGIDRLSPEDAEELRLYGLSGRKIPKAASTALGQDKSGSYLSIQSVNARPPDIDPLIGDIVGRRDEVNRKLANAAHPAVLSELLRDPHLTQDGLSPEIKSALSRIDKIMLNPEQGLGTDDPGQSRRTLNSLFGAYRPGSNFTDEDTHQLLQGATRRQYIRENGANAFLESRDRGESQRVINQASDANEYQYQLDQRQAEVDAYNKSLAGRQAARDSSVHNAGQSLRNSQEIAEHLQSEDFNPRRLRDRQDAERRLNAATAPITGDIAAQLKRVRRPEKIAALKEQTAQLTLTGITKGELQRVAANLADYHAQALEAAVAVPRPEAQPDVVAEVEKAVSEKKRSSRAATSALTGGSNNEPVRVRSMDEARGLAATDGLDEDSVFVPDGQGGWQSLSQATSGGGKRKKKRSSRSNTPKASKADSAAAANAAPAVDEAEVKVAQANAEYAQILNEDLAAIREAITATRNQMRNLRRRQSRGSAGYENDEELGGNLVALQEERDRLTAELKSAAAGGGGGKKPPTAPPAPPAGSNPEPEPERTPSSNARLFPVPGTAPGADQARRLAGLRDETQAALTAARTTLANPVTSIDNEASRAVQQQAIIRAAAAFKADPESARFKGAADKSTAFAQALGLDTTDPHTRSFLRRQVLNQGGLADQFNDARRLRAQGQDQTGATPSDGGVVHSARSVEGATGQVTAALKAQVIAANNLESALERLAKVQANTASTAAELRDAENGVARAEIQTMSAARNVAGAQDAAARAELGRTGNLYQRTKNAGRTGSFGGDLLRHGTNALENTIGYTLVFTGFEKLKEIVHTGLEADAAFVRLKASLDANNVSVGNLQSNLAQISATTATPLQHVIEAASELAGTFKNIGDLTFATNIASQLANISQGTLTAKEAAIGLRDVATAFGTDWVASGDSVKKNIQATGDQIAHLSQLTGVSIKDITEGTTQIAQEAHDFGLNQRQSATLAAYVTQGTGETGEQSASQLSRMLSSLYNGKAQTQLIKLGIATPEEFQNGKIGEVLTNLIGKYDGLNAASKQSVAALLGTGIQARAFAALMNGGAAAVKELNGQMDDTGALARQNQAYLNTVAGAIKQLSEDFQNLGSTLAHLGAFDAIGILANALDKLFKEFNKVFGGIANIMNSNPITATMLHFTAVILEAAAAWKVFGSAATTALVRSGAVSAAQLGVGVKNADAIARAEGAAAFSGAAAPAAKYERAGFGTVVGGLGRNARTKAGSVLTPSGRAARAEAAGIAAASREAEVAAANDALLAANRELTQAEVREAQVVTRLTSTEAELNVAAANTARALEAVAVAAAAAAEATEANAAANSQGAISRFVRGGFTSSPLALAGLGLGVAAIGTYIGGNIANKHFAAQGQADDALLAGSTDPDVYSKTQIPGGASGFADQYFGKGNYFQHFGNAAVHTGESFVNLLTGQDIFGGGQTGPSDKSNNQYLALLNEVYNQNPTAAANGKKTLGYGNATKTGIDQLKNLKSSGDVAKWLKAESDFIDKHAKDIEKAGGNDKNSQAQIAYSINQLKSNLTKSAQDRLAALQGLSQIDILNSQQSQLLSQASQQFSQLNGRTLRSNPDAVNEIINDTGVPQGSRAYNALTAAGNGNLSQREREQAAVTADQVNLKSILARLGTVGQQGGVAKGTDEYNNLIQTRDQLLTAIQTEQTNLLSQPIAQAQALAQLNTTTGNYSGAVAQMQAAIAGLQALNSTLGPGGQDDPQQFIQNLQQIQALRLQIAQTAIMPQLNQIALGGVSNDPLTQAKSQHDAALLNLQATQKAFQAAANEAVVIAQTNLDDFIKTLSGWDGFGGDPSAVANITAKIQALQAALSGAKSTASSPGNDPATAAANLAAQQTALAERNAEESLKEAQYTASVAHIRNATGAAQASLTGILQQEAYYRQQSDTGSRQKLAELQASEVQARASIRDSIEADKESQYDATAALQKVHGDNVGAAQSELTKARAAYAYALREYGRSSKQANDAYAALVQASADFQDAVLTQINSNLELQIAQLTARGQAGDLATAAQDKVQEARNALQEYLKKGGKKGTATYNQLLGDIATAQRAAFDQQLQDQLDTLDFQQQTYQITSSQEVAALQQILKNKQLTLAEQRAITLKIKSLQDSIRQQLTQGGLNIPSNITLPTAYDVRRSLGAGFAGNGGTQVNTVNNNQQVVINNNVPNSQVAAAIANSVIELINQQTSMGLRASSSTPRTVQTR